MNKNSENKWAILRKGLKKLIREQHRKDEGLWDCEYCGWPTSTDKFKCDKCLNICKFRVLVRKVIKAADERKKEAVKDDGSVRTLAVMDFSGMGISGGEAQALTERLRVELFNEGGFKLLERGMMETILQEQGFQQTGCVDS